MSNYEQVLQIFREVGDRNWEGETLNSLGQAYNAFGKKEDALKSYKEALRIVQEVEDREGEGITLHNIGILFKRYIATMLHLLVFYLPDLSSKK